ncbi:FMN-dependent NADH-azoreductase [Leptolyngbya sp. NK1-12]|uniref:FMN dependent NADH:quinone oxidoreductase n=1 Tax=Leptolyngbya sp. NK1-12 TaxID=2547451 RepID=A0AA97AML1_9CYAN|nr:FMN-dependent NADH-azoreductase [Leptolyngbya sp. NK1-12]WNZ25817.1 FMN-dependent NADH-azoreductase [Leptolyngbya sp. NK1-12]
MTHVLHIDTSPRLDRSHSRLLAREFLEQWKTNHPNATITHRDLARQPIPYINDTWVSAKFTSADQYTPELAAAIALSDELIDEFLSADRYVLSTPMYNFGIPAVLKSYIDYIVRPKRTFAATEAGFKGLVTNKKMVLVQTRGSDFRPGSVYDAVNFQEPYLKTVFGFIGITDIEAIAANGLNTHLREQELATAQTALQRLSATW